MVGQAREQRPQMLQEIGLETERRDQDVDHLSLVPPDLLGVPRQPAPPPQLRGQVVQRALDAVHGTPEGFLGRLVRHVDLALLPDEEDVYEAVEARYEVDLVLWPVRRFRSRDQRWIELAVCQIQGPQVIQVLVEGQKCVVRLSLDLGTAATQQVSNEQPASRYEGVDLHLPHVQQPVEPLEQLSILE